MLKLFKYIFLKLLIVTHRIPMGRLFYCRTGNNSVLILKIDAIGDSIVWLDTAKEYRNLYPDKTLVLLYNSDWEEIALLLPYFDKFIPFNSKKFWKKISYRFKILAEINKQKYDVAINPTYSRSFFYQDWMMHNINAEEKIGSSGDYNNTNNTIAKLTKKFSVINPKLKKIGDSWYTRLVEVSNKPTMELVRNAEFIRNAYGIDFKAHLPIFPFNIPVYKELEGKRYCVIFMGAATERRIWDIEKYAEIINTIPSEYEIVICGGKKESYLFDRLTDLNTINRLVISLFGKTTLIGLVGVIKNAAFIITNETSASHITVATRTRSVCILGGGHYGRFQPYEVEEITDEDSAFLPRTVSLSMECFNCGWICKYNLINGRWKCIADISVDSVKQKLADLIN